MIPWLMIEVVGIVFISSVSMELISWIVLWRPESYKRAIQEAEAVYKRLEPTMRYRGESGDAVRASKADKRKSNRDSSFLKVSQSMMRIRMYSGVLSFLPVIVLYQYLSSIYKGRTAATLPFEPIPLFYRLTHAAIEGEDYSICSAMFIYYLAGFGIKANVSKIFSFGPPKHLSDFFGPQHFAEQTDLAKKTK